MGRSTRLVAALVGCAFLIAAGCAFAQDWPQWRGVNRDGKVTSFSVPEGWSGELTKKWTVAVGSGDATPALVGDKLYVFTRQGDEETVLCLNAADGSQVWQSKYAAAAVTGPAARHPGPRSCPAVADGKVLTLGASGIVSCLDAADGKVLWQKDPFPGVVPMFFTSMSPMIADSMAIAHVGGQGNGALIAFDLATGEEKWRWAGEAPEYGSPALMTVDGVKVIVTLTEKSFVGVGLADGKLLWQIAFPPQRRAYNIATPIIDGQTVIYTGAARGAHAVKIAKGDDGFTVTEVWSNPKLAPQYNTPVLKNGLLFGLSDQSNLYCINAATGETAWVDTVAYGRGGFGSLLDVGEAILALPATGEAVAFEPVADGYKELARLKVAETETYAHPVLSGNRVFIKDQDGLTLWTAE